MDFNGVGKNKFYFDDITIGLRPETSHPNFANHFTDEFYYDSADEEAPFGSDVGHDVLQMLEESAKYDTDLVFSDFPKHLVETEWGMTYLPATTLSENALTSLLEESEIDVIQSDLVTIAVAFGQIKLCGRLDDKLKECATASIERRLLTAEILGWGEPSEIIYKMKNDLISFGVL